MKVQCLKIPHQCYSRSISRNLLNDVEFYYTLKTIDQNGFFRHGTVVSTIQQHTKYASATIWNKIRKLTNCNLLAKHKQGYRLVSYDKLFSVLGYDLTKTDHRKGQFKIHKIPVSQINDIKSWIALIDVRDNLNQQIHKAYYNLHKDKRYQYTENNLHCANKRFKQQVLESVAKNTVRMVDLNEEAMTVIQMDELHCKHNKANVYCNADVTLSLKGICKVLGLSSTSSAHRIVQRMKSNQLVEVKNRMMRLGATSIDYATYCKEYADRYILKDGALWRRLPNKISVGV